LEPDGRPTRRRPLRQAKPIPPNARPSRASVEGSGTELAVTLNELKVEVKKI
jgi:hypothetical protein